MNSKTSICNLALAYLGQAPIASLEQENEQARWLGLFYEPVRDEVLRMHDWAFAATTKRLTLVDAQAQKGVFLYKYPADALFVRRVVTARDHAPQPFSEQFDAQHQQRLVCCRVHPAYAQYTRRMTDETQYDPVFVKCLALALACDSALALTGDLQLAARLEQQYQRYLEEARRNNMSETLVRAPQSDAFSEVR